MRIDLTFNSIDGKEIRLSRINLYLLQAMIYKIMPDDLSDFLHNKGYQFEKRTFKLFAYSWLKGKTKPRFDDQFIYFTHPLKLSVTSPISETLQGIANGSLTNQKIRIGNTDLECTSVMVDRNMVGDSSIIVRTLSPVTCFSTLYRPDGSPYTVYHDPREEIFQQHITENLKKKFSLICPGKTVPDEPVSFQPIGNPRQQVARFRPDDPRPIKGWWGKFRLNGPEKLLQVALDAGLGAKNSAGFGCVESLNRERKEG